MSSDFLAEIIKSMIRTVGDTTDKFVAFVWDILLVFLKNHLLLVVIVVIALILFGVLMAFVGQRWVLGKILYHLLYFGIMLVLGLTFGSKIFTNIFFDLIALIVYIVSFIAVGRVYRRMG